VKAFSFIIIATIQALSSSSAFAESSSLHNLKPKNWGLESKAASVQKAWSLTEGSQNVVVAVIDTGIDPTHPDLKPNLWKAPSTGSRANSGSTYGWDFVTNTSNPSDSHGHGTHIAGIIAGVANTKNGTAGVCQHCQIMPIRYYSETAPGNVNLSNTIKAIYYAVKNGAKIINYSGGGPEYSEEEFQAMRAAEKAGVLIVAAAGNDHRDTDVEDNRYYPAAYQLKGLKNIVTVASHSEDGKLLPSSNWGSKSVDVAAPGESILSTLPGNRYGKMSGTSQATAFVSGIAGLILSKQPGLKPEQVKEIIMNNVDQLNNFYGKIASGGKVDANKAILALDPGHLPTRKTASALVH